MSKRTATLADLRDDPAMVLALAKTGGVSITDEHGVHRFWMSIPGEDLTCNCGAADEVRRLRVALAEACDLARQRSDNRMSRIAELRKLTEEP